MKKSEKLKAMLKDLQVEHLNDGFNEYSQFCEEHLMNFVDQMTDKQLTWLMWEVERTSIKDISRDNY